MIRGEMKKVVELLEQAKKSLDGTASWMKVLDSVSGALKFTNEALAELKTPRWIPYKNLTDALDYMSEAVKAVEEVTFRSRDDERRIKAALTRIECAKGAIETLIPLPQPRWETPEQWEKRTGEAWPDKGPVYYRCSRTDYWVVSSFEDARRDIVMSPLVLTADIICAAEAGPPPSGWRPEEEK
jgi:hypothetical protein